MSGETLLKGDVAICINNNRFTKKLTVGKEYLVKSSHYGKVLIEDDHGLIDYFPSQKFKEKKK
jgi:hypothetical protein